LGVPVLVTARSQASVTGVLNMLLVVAALVAESVEVAVIGVVVSEAATLTTTGMLTDAPEAKLGSVQVTVVTVVVQVQPAGAEADTTVVLGMDSVRLTPVAADGPPLVTVSV
jgi:shikimate kinase